MRIENAEERISPRLVRVLERVRDEWLPKDYDCIVLLEAPERGGKSTLGNLMCSIVDPTFEIETRNLYTQEQFQRFLNTTEKRKAVCLDESVSLFFRRNAMKKENKEGLISLTTMGQLNLFVVMPIVDATMIESYLLRKRARFFIKVTKRGRFKFFNPQATRRIYYDKRTMKMIYPPATFTGGYGKLHKAEWEAYENHKLKGIKTDAPQEVEQPNGTLLSKGKAAKYAGVSGTTINNWRKNGKLPATKVGSHWRYSTNDLNKIIGR